MTAPESSPKPAEAIARIQARWAGHSGELNLPRYQVEIMFKELLTELEAAAIQRGDGQTACADYTEQLDAMRDALSVMRSEGWEHIKNPKTLDAFHSLYEAWDKGLRKRITPPAAKPNETSGATPTAAEAFADFWKKEGSLLDLVYEDAQVGFQNGWEARELNAVRKSSGAAGAGAAEACLAEIRALMPKEWEGMELVWCVLQLKNAAKSTRGVEDGVSRSALLALTDGWVASASCSEDNQHFTEAEAYRVCYKELRALIDTAAKSTRGVEKPWEEMTQQEQAEALQRAKLRKEAP